MAHRFISPSTTLGAVRRYFGFNQQEMALFLEVGKAMIGHIESGRREMSSALWNRLRPLLGRLPVPRPVADAADEALPATASAPDPVPLLERRRFCQLKAKVLRYQLRPLVARAVYASRWQEALPAVLAEMPVPDDPLDKDLDEAIRKWLAGRPRQFGPGRSAEYHLLRLQAEALETEAAAITALLEGQGVA